MGLRSPMGPVAAFGPLVVALSASGVLPDPTRTAGVRVAVEVTAALVSLLAARLLLGRFRRTLLLPDLVLAASLLVFAAANLALSALPAAAAVDATPELSWAALLVRLLAAGLLTAAAFAPGRVIRCPAEAARRWLVATQATAAALAACGALLGASAGAPGDAGVLAAVALGAALAASAAGFWRRGGGDALYAWLGVAGVLGGCAWWCSALAGAVGRDAIGAADLLRVGFFAALAAAGAVEIRLAQDALARAAVDDERRRIARDLHDGTAQDLAFILQFARRLATRPGAPAGTEHAVAAAHHALAASREAITELTRPLDEPLTDTLERAARTVAERQGVAVDVRVAEDVTVPPAIAQALARIVREGVTNAVRHGGAGRVVIELPQGPDLRLRIADDGRGFDAPERVGAGHGLVGMRERVSALDGELRIRSAPGDGTELLVVLP